MQFSALSYRYGKYAYGSWAECLAATPEYLDTSPHAGKTYFTTMPDPSREVERFFCNFNLSTTPVYSASLEFTVDTIYYLERYSKFTPYYFDWGETIYWPEEDTLTRATTSSIGPYVWDATARLTNLTSLVSSGGKMVFIMENESTDPYNGTDYAFELAHFADVTLIINEDQVLRPKNPVTIKATKYSGKYSRR